MHLSYQRLNLGWLTSADESAWSQLDNFLGVALEGVWSAVWSQRRLRFVAAWAAADPLTAFRSPDLAFSASCRRISLYIQMWTNVRMNYMTILHKCLVFLKAQNLLTTFSQTVFCPCQRKHWVGAYLLFGQVLLQHDVHIWPDLQLGVRRFAPCAKEHQQEQRTLISIHSRDLSYYKHSKHKQSAKSDSLYQQINLHSCFYKQLMSY